MTDAPPSTPEGTSPPAAAAADKYNLLDETDRLFAEDVANLTIDQDLAEARKKKVAAHAAANVEAIEGAMPAAPAPVDWQKRFDELDASNIVTSAVMLERSKQQALAPPPEKRAPKPKTNDECQELLYKLMPGFQVEALRQHDDPYRKTTMSYLEFYKHLDHCQKSMLEGSRRVDWIDPHMSNDFKLRKLGSDLIPVGVGHGYAALVARLEQADPKEASYRIYLAHIAGANSATDTLVNERSMCEAKSVDKEDNVRQAALKQQRRLSFEPSDSGVFEKPAACHIHGEVISVMWHVPTMVTRVRLYRLPRCSGDPRDVIPMEWPADAISAYDIYFPYMVMACRRDKLREIKFLWALKQAERFTSLLDQGQPYPTDVVVVFHLTEFTFMRAVPLKTDRISALSFSPRQTNWSDNLLHNAMQKTEQATAERQQAENLLHQESKRPDFDKSPLQRNLVDDMGTKLAREVDAKRNELHVRQNLFVVWTSVYRGPGDPPKESQDRHTCCMPNAVEPSKIREASKKIDSVMLWKTPEQELQHLEQHGYAPPSAPNEPAERVFRYHDGSLVQWSRNNRSTMLHSHPPFCPQNEIYWVRGSAPIDSVIYGHMCITLQRGYKLEFSCTRSPKAGHALRLISHFDIANGLPLRTGQFDMQLEQYDSRFDRPLDAEVMNYKAIWTSLERICVLFPSGELVVFTARSAQELERIEVALKAVEREKQRQRYQQELTERKVNEAMRLEEATKAAALAAALNPAPMQS
jgi:ribosomal protein S21